MRNLVPIITGDPNSINSEIIAKAWKKRSLFRSTDIFLIGNYNLIKKQIKSIGIKIKINKIKVLNNQNFKKKLFIYDVPLKFKNIFNVSSIEKSKYILKCFKIAIQLQRKRLVTGLINCPINKKETFGENFTGITEFIAKKEGVLGREVMLIFNKKLSVSPITTHIKIKNISKSISKKRIINNVVTINKFFFDKLKFKPKIAILGLNPHNDEFKKNSEELKIIIPAIKFLKKKRILVYGPLSPDTAFLNLKKNKFDVIIGMYHDQVLSPFKAIYKFKAINITLGIPSFIRVSPDHGVGKDIIRKNLANPESLIETIKFFDNKNVKF